MADSLGVKSLRPFAGKKTSREFLEVDQGILGCVSGNELGNAGNPSSQADLPPDKIHIGKAGCVMVANRPMQPQS